jgi:hypothetical protein
LTNKYNNSINRDAVTFISESEYTANCALVNSPKLQGSSGAGELIQSRLALLLLGHETFESTRSPDTTVTDEGLDTKPCATFFLEALNWRPNPKY